MDYRLIWGSLEPQGTKYSTGHIVKRRGPWDEHHWFVYYRVSTA